MEKEQEEEEEMERIMLSEHDLESVSRVCACAREPSERSLLLTCHWLLSDVGADNGGRERI